MNSITDYSNKNNLNWNISTKMIIITLYENLSFMKVEKSLYKTQFLIGYDFA